MNLSSHLSVHIQMAFDLDQSKSPYGVNTPKIKFLKFQAEVLLISEVSVFIYGSMSGQKQCLNSHFTRTFILSLI